MNQLPPISAGKISEISQDPTFARYIQIVKRFDEASVQRVVEPQLAAPDTLCFVSTPDQLKMALDGGAPIVVASAQLKITAEIGETGQALYATPSIPAAMTLILPFFDQKLTRFAPGIHPTAVVDSSAQIGQDVRIGPYAVIGAQAILADQAVIGSHVVIESGATVGAKTILHPHTFIGARCRIGNFCEIHPHTTIGSDGFGFVQGPDQRRHKIPQLGIVVLEDHVEIGANCAVDRATLGETRIGEGSKLDNLCHIGHNNKIGKNSVFAGGFLMAGSSEIGDNCMIGGSTAVTDHVRIGSNIIIGGRAGVTKDVLEPGAYTGYPLEPMKDGLRTLANLPNLTSMRKQLAQIRKHLGLKDET